MHKIKPVSRVPFVTRHRPAIACFPAPETALYHLWGCLDAQTTLSGKIGCVRTFFVERAENKSA